MTISRLTISMILVLILVLVCLLIVLLLKFLRPNGLLHIDEYIDKDFYRMVYFTPVGDIKKYRYVVLKVEKQSWNTHSEDYEEDF